MDTGNHWTIKFYTHCYHHFSFLSINSPTTFSTTCYFTTISNINLPLTLTTTGSLNSTFITTSHFTPTAIVNSPNIFACFATNVHFTPATTGPSNFTTTFIATSHTSHFSPTQLCNHFSHN